MKLLPLFLLGCSLCQAAETNIFRNIVIGTNLFKEARLVSLNTNYAMFRTEAGFTKAMYTNLPPGIKSNLLSLRDVKFKIVKPGPEKPKDTNQVQSPVIYSIEEDRARRAATMPRPSAITVGVIVLDDGIVIKSYDPFDYKDLTIYVDGMVLGYRIDGLQMEGESILPIRFDDITKRNGNRFPWRQKKPKEIVVHEKGFDARVFNY